VRLEYHAKDLNFAEPLRSRDIEGFLRFSDQERAGSDNVLHLLDLFGAHFRDRAQLVSTDSRPLRRNYLTRHDGEKAHRSDPKLEFFNTIGSDLIIGPQKEHSVSLPAEGPFSGHVLVLLAPAAKVQKPPFSSKCA
jgi:hypothetical protein